ncbi:MAG: hypothetical protein KGI00_01060 [Candidatus Micrarchaeota archaeon]|nr:hypothetical protein [Candidatus Micrarchaeota archaeon]MDE1823883.1 hypothetical protein [Candidatus Micrarchaeota archaeon]MDE1849297.1 hypothetical protein [Candidatus Micrarchaeota archaeon]
MMGKNARMLQSAMEYLTTYSWAFLLIAIATTTFVALGILNPSGQIVSCALPANLECNQALLSSNGILYLSIANANPYPIKITASGCNSNQTGIVTQSQSLVIQGGSTAAISTQCYSGTTAFSGKIGSLFRGTLQLNYTETQTGIPHVVYGQLLDKVTSGVSITTSVSTTV